MVFQFDQLFDLYSVFCILMIIAKSVSFYFDISLRWRDAKGFLMAPKGAIPFASHIFQMTSLSICKSDAYHSQTKHQF